MANYGICCSINGNFIIVSIYNIYLPIKNYFVFFLSVLNVNLKFSPFRASCPSLKYQIKNDYLKISKTLIAGRSNRKDHVNKGRENERKSGEKSAIFVKKLSLWAHIQKQQKWQLGQWHYRLWSFQGKDTKLERFLHKNQLQSNEIIEF